MIEVSHLTKRFGATTAVDDVSFRVEPGRVTGFLGPNGAGKTTTMRMILGLDRPSAGTATVDGRPYATLEAPLASVGALLDAGLAHPGRSARDHMRVLAATHRIPTRRVDEVLDLAGIGSVAKRRLGTFSLGMRQRLGIAGALLGDPATLVFDEPVNGLDPEGVIWIRSLARQLAAEGRAVLISSHLMSEMAQTADHLVVLGAGRVLADAPVHEVVAASGATRVRIRTSDLGALAPALTATGAAVVATGPDTAEVTGATAEMVARTAAAQGALLTDLTTLEQSLEEAFFALTGDAVQYRAGLAGADRTTAQGGTR